MRDSIRVLVLGTGQMGSGIIRLVLDKRGLEFAGAFARRASRAGLEVGQAIGLERDLGIRVSTDLAKVIEQRQPHVAIQATCSSIDDAMGEIALLVRHGVPVISIAEQMAYPACSSPAFAEEIHWLAVSRGVAVVGTGINPGFVLDLLVITLSGVCADIQSISAERVNDLSPYGPTVLASQGVGLSPEAFEEGLEAGTVVGHIGFPESIHLIAKTIGWDIERVEEKREAHHCRGRTGITVRERAARPGRWLSTHSSGVPAGRAGHYTPPSAADSPLARGYRDRRPDRDQRHPRCAIVR